MNALKKYFITMLCGLVCAAAIIWSKDIFGQTELSAIFHILCDGFFVVGVLLTCIGLLIFTSNEGVFDGIAYSVRAFVDMFRKTGMKKYDSYYDYKAAKEDKDAPFAFLIFCGLFYMAVSMVMLYCYYLYM
jgi:hypothetical protein